MSIISSRPNAGTLLGLTVTGAGLLVVSLATAEATVVIPFGVLVLAMVITGAAGWVIGTMNTPVSRASDTRRPRLAAAARPSEPEQAEAPVPDALFEQEAAGNVIVMPFLRELPEPGEGDRA